VKKKLQNYFLNFRNTFLVLRFTAISIQLPLVIEYQFLLTDVYNLDSREKHWCQNCVYLSPKNICPIICMCSEAFSWFLDTTAMVRKNNSNNDIWLNVLTTRFGDKIVYKRIHKLENKTVNNVIFVFLSIDWWRRGCTYWKRAYIPRRRSINI